jgi:hypothetical protein
LLRESEPSESGDTEVIARLDPTPKLSMGDSESYIAFDFAALKQRI